MATVRLSNAARADFDDIIDHLVVVAGSRIAREYAENIRASMNRLADFPGIGTPRRALGRRTRIVSVEPYAILYDGGPKSELVHVLRILHGHMNMTPALIARGRQP
jgi:plasmid stabilization system protein ParE